MLSVSDLNTLSFILETIMSLDSICYQNTSISHSFVYTVENKLIPLYKVLMEQLIGLGIGHFRWYKPCTVVHSPYDPYIFDRCWQNELPQFGNNGFILIMGVEKSIQKDFLYL